jgi:signal transduction histidine kinase
MVREADRLNRVITDLLFLSRSKSIAPQQVDLASLLQEITALLRFDLEQKNTSIESTLEAPRIFADEEALKQALLNLLLNSLDALEAKKEKHTPSSPLLPAVQQHGGSELNEGSAGAAHCPASPLLPSSLAADRAAALRIVSGFAPDGVWIEVRDSGCGMTQEQQAQALEPFFTTKKRGTGLGLALVQRTMLDHAGSTIICSEPDNGCTVRLFFPNAQPQL